MKRFYLSLVLLLFMVSSAFAAVNINTASVKELEALPGIGVKKAEAIVKYRDEHGKFKTKQDLAQVKGIGDKLLEKISSEIEVK